MKYTLHALSIAKILSRRAKVTHQRVHTDQNNNQPTTVSHSKRQKRMSAASSPTSTLADYPLEHVEAAAEGALDDALKSLKRSSVSSSW